MPDQSAAAYQRLRRAIPTMEWPVFADDIAAIERLKIERNAIVLAPKIHEAVVIAPTTPIRATPVPMGDPLLQLSEAETVTIGAGHEDFVLVRTASGHSGWVARADLADVVPRRSVR